MSKMTSACLHFRLARTETWEALKCSAWTQRPVASSIPETVANLPGEPQQLNQQCWFSALFSARGSQERGVERRRSTRTAISLPLSQEESYWFVQSFGESETTRWGDLPANGIGVVLAAAAWPFDGIIALLAEFEATKGR